MLFSKMRNEAMLVHVPNIVTLHAEPVPESGKLVSTVNFTWSCITLCHQLRRTAPGPARRALGSSWQHARNTTAIFCCPNSASVPLRWPHSMKFVSSRVSWNLCPPLFVVMCSYCILENVSMELSLHEQPDTSAIYWIKHKLTNINLQLFLW